MNNKIENQDHYELFSYDDEIVKRFALATMIWGREKHLYVAATGWHPIWQCQRRWSLLPTDFGGLRLSSPTTVPQRD